MDITITKLTSIHVESGDNSITIYKDASDDGEPYYEIQDETSGECLGIFYSKEDMVSFLNALVTAAQDMEELD